MMENRGEMPQYSDSDEPAGMPLGEMQRLLEPGMLADVIVVDGDPIEDIEALGRIVAVVKDGGVAFSQPKQ
jgi:hypothetical protein